MGYGRRGRQQVKIITIERGREVEADRAEHRRLEASIAVDVNRYFNEQGRYVDRPVDAPDRASVKRAMANVEHALVRALWTLARLPDRSPFGGGRCGLEYIPDAQDRFSNAVANGGKWEQLAPRPSPPSSRAIDMMDQPLEWLTWLPRNHAKLVSTAAATKRGDVERRVSWARVRLALPDTNSQSIRTLQRRYDDGIRQIVARLTA